MKKIIISIPSGTLITRCRHKKFQDSRDLASRPIRTCSRCGKRLTVKKKSEPKQFKHEFLFGSEGHSRSVFTCPCRPSVTGTVITHGSLPHQKPKFS